MRFIALLLCLVVVAAPSAAQEALDPFAEPKAGSTTIFPGFSPDPYRIPAVGGGEVDVISRALGEDCAGFITVPPDFRLTATDSFPLLRFIFIADTIMTDSSLIVRDPDGRFLCNNNASFGIFNPMVNAVDALPGDYAVWVGSFTPNAPVYGDLYVTTNSGIVAGSTGIVIPIATLPPTVPPVVTSPPPIISEADLNPSLPPAHGRVVLEAGFLPDPYWTVVAGGGMLSPLEGECSGYTDSAPDFRLEWRGRSTRLRFHFVPVMVDGREPDAGLIVQSPDEEWVCNRNFAPGFTRPSVEFINPVEGVYHVWVSDEREAGTSITGVLYITEITSSPDTVRQAATMPVHGLIGLDYGEVSSPLSELSFPPDPVSVSGLLAGGGLDIAEFNPDLMQFDPNQACVGFYSTTPTLVLNLVQPLPYLRTFFVADDAADDPTLIVRMPDGQWYCGDDSFSTRNPTLNIVGNPSSGTMRIWAGAYNAGDFIAGTLYFTRGSASPLAGGVAGVPTPTLVIATDIVQPQTLPTAVPMQTPPPVANPAGLEPDGVPNYGEVSLGAAFIPHTLEANSGGALDATALGGECVGYITAQPDYRVQWSGRGDFLRFYFVGLGDTTLIVYSPDGTWHCNDDSYVSVNPTVDVVDAIPGVYNIWIGSYAFGFRISGTLHITEDASRHPGN